MECCLGLLKDFPVRSWQDGSVSEDIFFFFRELGLNLLSREECHLKWTVNIPGLGKDMVLSSHLIMSKSDHTVGQLVAVSAGLLSK